MRTRVNSLSIEIPNSGATSGSSNEVRTASRRSRANTVNMVEPEPFIVGMEVSSPVTLKTKLSRLFKPIDPWAEDAKEVLARFDEKLVAISVEEGEKLLAEGVTLVDDSYKDKPVFLEAVENICVLIPARTLPVPPASAGNGRIWRPRTPQRTAQRSNRELEIQNTIQKSAMCDRGVCRRGYAKGYRWFVC